MNWERMQAKQRIQGKAVKTFMITAALSRSRHTKMNCPPIPPPRLRPTNLGTTDLSPPDSSSIVNWRSNHSPNSDSRPGVSPHRKKVTIHHIVPPKYVLMFRIFWIKRWPVLLLTLLHLLQLRRRLLQLEILLIIVGTLLNLWDDITILTLQFLRLIRALFQHLSR